VKNPEHVEKGIKSLIVNGTEVEGNLIPVSMVSGDEVNVEAIMG
jgi:hypothetical protein